MPQANEPLQRARPAPCFAARPCVPENLSQAGQLLHREEAEGKGIHPSSEAQQMICKVCEEEVEPDEVCGRCLLCEACCECDEFDYQGCCEEEE